MYATMTPELTLDKKGEIRKICENCHNAMVIEMTGDRWHYNCIHGRFSAKHPACEDFLPHGYVRVHNPQGTFVMPWEEATKWLFNDADFEL